MFEDGKVIIHRKNEEIIALGTQIVFLQSQLAAQTEKYIAAEKKIIENESKLKNYSYYRYCNIVRDEISKYDRYARSTGFSYTPFEADLEMYTNWEDLEEQKRKLRLIHILSNSTEPEVLRLSRKIPADMDIPTFAFLIAKAFRLISKEIHDLSRFIEFVGLYCPKVTRDKNVNLCINLLMEDVELNVGEMVPASKRMKLDE